MGDETAAPQAPSTGRLRRWLGPFYFNGIFWYRFPYWMAGHVPLPLLALSLRLLSTCTFLLVGGIRRGLRANLALVDPACGWWRLSRRALRTLHVFSWCLAERYQQFYPNSKLQLEFEGKEHWEAARAEGRGVIVVTSHIGGWEIGSAVPSSHEAETTVHVVREREADQQAQAFTEELLEKHGGASYRTHFADADQDLSLELYAALRDGDVVALQGDRPRHGGKVERVEMFGRELCLPPGPAQLARLAGVPLLPVFTFREGRGSYRVVLCEPIYVERSRDRQRDVHDAVQRLALVIERAIRRHPDQWFCFSPIADYSGSDADSK